MYYNRRKKHLPVVGITMGDYNGIGPEVLIKALAYSQKLFDAIFVIIGSVHVINTVNHALKRLISPLVINSFIELKKAKHNIFLLDIFEEKEVDVNYGVISEEAGIASAECLRQGIELAKNNSIQVLVTAPVSKQALKMAGNDYPGQTEMIAELTNTNTFIMMFISNKIKVGLATTHCAISEVAFKIDKEVVLQKIQAIDSSLKHDFKKKRPHIAVSNLNPHSGEGGLFGKEEQYYILPAINEAKKNDIEVFGPFPADTLFANIQNSHYDAYLAMYHDQGLIPLKMISFGRGVNFTAGLPIIRTSPDHGTAFDIAGKWMADEHSMIEAIKIGYQLAKKRMSR